MRISTDPEQRKIHLRMFRLTLLGYPKVEVDARAIHPSRRKAIALLAYLAVTGKSHSRETLANLLWPGYPSTTALAHLRRILHAIRSDLGAQCLILDRVRIALALTQDVWCDVSHLRHLRATHTAECRHEPHENCATCLDRLHTIVELYHNDFLAGFSLKDCPEFELWQSVEGEILRQEMASIFERIAIAEEKANRLGLAIRSWERLLQLIPLHDYAQQSLMRLYTQRGQRDTALRLYHTYCHQLKQELDALPALPLQQLYEQIRTGQAIEDIANMPAAPRTATAPQPLVVTTPPTLTDTARKLATGPQVALGILQRKKQTYFFRRLDQDGDGQIHWQDFERYMIQAATLLGLAPEDQSYQRARSDLRNWWSGIVVASTFITPTTLPPETAEPRGVTLEAWLLYWGMVQMTVAEEAALGGRETLDRMAESVYVHFRLFDQDRDNRFSLTDYHHWGLAWGLALNAEYNFQRLDLDGDGYLQQTEVAEYLRQFHFSNDPDTLGNYFYGEFY